MTNDEISPFLGKCVAVYLEAGDIFQGFLRPDGSSYLVDTGTGVNHINAADLIDYIELLKMPADVLKPA